MEYVNTKLVVESYRRQHGGKMSVMSGWPLWVRDAGKTAGLIVERYALCVWVSSAGLQQGLMFLQMGIS